MALRLYLDITVMRDKIVTIHSSISQIVHTAIKIEQNVNNISHTTNNYVDKEMAVMAKEHMAIAKDHMAMIKEQIKENDKVRQEKENLLKKQNEDLKKELVYSDDRIKKKELVYSNRIKYGFGTVTGIALLSNHVPWSKIGEKLASHAPEPKIAIFGLIYATVILYMLNNIFNFIAKIRLLFNNINIMQSGNIVSDGKDAVS